MTQSTPQAQPFGLFSDPHTTALVMIDIQRGLVEARGPGEALGNGISLIHTVIAPHTKVLAATRQKGIMVIHTREGHRADLSDCPPIKLTRGRKTFIGEPEPMERILIRGEAGHDIIPELYPVAGGSMIDKSGKGTFYRTDLHLIPQDHGIRTLIVCGVTTEVCVTTTVHEVSDHGYEYIVPEDCVDPYFPEFQRYTLKMIKVQGVISDWVTDPKAIIIGLEG